MFNDPELKNILGELKNLSNTEGEKMASVHVPKQVSKGKALVNDLASSLKNVKNKDLTLGEYLESYKKIDTGIDADRSTRMQEKADADELAELLSCLDGADYKEEPQEIKENISKSKSLLDSAYGEKGFERINTDGARHTKNTAWYVDANGDQVFNNMSKERIKPMVQRMKSYANSKASITTENRMSPLSLTQYLSE